MAVPEEATEFSRRIGELLPRLYRFALVLARSPPDADDLVQCACERALVRARQFTADTRLDRWLFRILHSIWLNELRSRAVRSRFRLREQQARQVAENSLGRPDTTLLLREMLAIAFELPAEQRSVLLLICGEGFTYRETADTLGIPIGTVVSRLARARLALMERVARADRASAPKRLFRPAASWPIEDSVRYREAAVGVVRASPPGISRPGAAAWRRAGAAARR